MKQLFFWIVLAPLTVLVVVFSLGNRDRVTVDLWPLAYQADLPLFLLVLGALIVGFAVGGLYAMVTGAARRARREHLRREKADRKARITPGDGAATSTPATPAASNVPQIPLKAGKPE